MASKDWALDSGSICVEDFPIAIWCLAEHGLMQTIGMWQGTFGIS